MKTFIATIQMAIKMEIKAEDTAQVQRYLEKMPDEMKFPESLPIVVEEATIKISGLRLKRTEPKYLRCERCGNTWEYKAPDPISCPSCGASGPNTVY